MELDELRRNWQQPQPPAAAFTSTELQTLLKSRRGGIEKMRRNARFEAAATALVVLLAIGTCGWAFVHPDKDSARYGVFSAFLVGVGMGQLYYYYQKLQVLQRMAVAEADVRRHLIKLCTQLRGLLRYYYYASLGSLPASLFMMLCYTAGWETGRCLRLGCELPIIYTRLWHVMEMAAVLLVVGLVLLVPVYYGTRWYLQRLYGQHLDRLENLLRELETEQ